MTFGIEFEYMFVDLHGPQPGRIRDFGNLAFDDIARILHDTPGEDDPRLATGDLGIRRGYWYLEGDERFHADGRFKELVVKGVEIRTPPEPDIASAVRSLLQIETLLAARLAAHGLGLAISGYNPGRDGYTHDPPLNAWEAQLRRSEPSYGGSLVSTVTYGPDINLSLAEWSAEQSLDIARKLNWYSPYLVPFSFSSPYAAGKPWGGYSKRTFERAGQRPAVKLYLEESSPDFARVRVSSTLLHEARSRQEHGRIEFKAFDAVPTTELLSACAYLLLGVCLDRALQGRSEDCDLALYHRAALHAFGDDAVHAGAREVLTCARAALAEHGHAAGVRSLALLAEMLERGTTPAQALLAQHKQTGRLYWPGGLCAGAFAGVVETCPPQNL